MDCRFPVLAAICAATLFAVSAHGADPPSAHTTARSDKLLADTFEARVHHLATRDRGKHKTLEDWTSRRAEYRRQLADMLGLWPEPVRTPLNVQITGKFEHPEFTVENLHYQSRPGLYVTGNLYVPKGLTKPAPAILYVCGHGNVKKDGYSYGAKSFYQHHGAWLARNGYVCLTIDTLQLGEIEGLHHGTYREGMWWWPSRGYTPAGVEAWNGIRALDYLQSRPEVDPERLGITGRSGGGAYSWWVSALDERIKCAVPVAGITDLENHVVDGTIEGHCDCMFMVNTYGWDFERVASLVAPRPLLISNTDKDPIFPLEGVNRVHAGAREIYSLYGARDKLGLLITEGPHQDTQDLQVPATHWFNRFLKGEDAPLSTYAAKLFEPEKLRVYSQIPSDQKNTAIHETFVPAAPLPEVPKSKFLWDQLRDRTMAAISHQCFGGWPENAAPVEPREAFSVKRDGIQLSAFDFESEPYVPLRLYVVHKAGLKKPELTVLNVLDEAGWRDFQASLRPTFDAELALDPLAAPGDPPLPLAPADAKAAKETADMIRGTSWVMAYLAPRGVGPNAWNPEERKQTQIKRRFMLVGQTLDGQRVWDVRRAIQTLRTVPSLAKSPLWLQGRKGEAGLALYASLFEPDIKRLDLWELPKSLRDGPFFLNGQKTHETPLAVALAAERTNVIVYQADKAGWEYPVSVGKALGWDEKRFTIRGLPD